MRLGKFGNKLNEIHSKTSFKYHFNKYLVQVLKQLEKHIWCQVKKEKNKWPFK